MKKWVDVTDEFLEEARYYNDTYLEICEVYDDKVEVSYFSSQVKPCEIYFSYDIFYGIIRTDEENSQKLRAEIKEELEKEYNINEKVTDEFINYFDEKYNVSLPNNLFFDPADIFNLFGF